MRMSARILEILFFFCCWPSLRLCSEDGKVNKIVKYKVEERIREDIPWIYRDGLEGTKRKKEKPKPRYVVTCEIKVFRPLKDNI